jgi:ribosomal protein S12 methylthiotransferase
LPRAKPFSFQGKWVKNSTVALYNLGCAKNLVDGESMVRFLESSGFAIVNDYGRADIILVNTCAFIAPAKEEAIDAILDMARFKTEGRCKQLVVCGCFSQRYRNQVKNKFPEVDHWIGVHTWKEDFSRIFHAHSRGNPKVFRTLQEPIATQYLKISDGCSHHCTFCVIPSIRGTFTSRSFSQLRDEAAWLYDQGVRECILVSQDTSYYGRDIGSSFSELLVRLLRDTAFPWIRFMYLHPHFVDDELLGLVGNEPRLCPYFDIPLQHIVDPILSAMNRRPQSGEIYKLIERIRTAVPGAAVRTTFITGFPGETRAHFKQLLDFVQWARFEKLGVFPYSAEEGTPAAALRPRPATATANRRCEELMEVQRHISRSIGEKRIGAVIPVIVEKKSDTGPRIYECRSRWDAPEVDGTVWVTKKKLPVGGIITVNITGADDYDLYASNID